jgi:hypothetical protein
MSRHRAGKRPWLAAVLAVIYPGLGHLYLRRWFRALAWFLLVFLTVQITLPQSALPESGEFSVEAVLEASQALPIEATFALLVLTILNIADAYYLARQRNAGAEATRSGASGSDGPVGSVIGTEADDDEPTDRCPHCGRTTDTDLDFCQWCGDPLDTDPS